jgi:hypothetical protein
VLPPEALRKAGAAVVAARALAPLSVVAALALGVGCGDDDDEEPVNLTGTQLQIGLDADGPGGAEAKTALVNCEQADGSACGRLSAIDFAPTDPQTPCTEIYGGPDVVELSGFIGDEPIETTLTRQNGCEIARFDPIVPLLKEEFPGYEPGAALAP